MSYHEFILVVNFSSIIILVLLAMLLLIATRFRGESGYAAAIIVLFPYQLFGQYAVDAVAVVIYPPQL